MNVSPYNNPIPFNNVSIYLDLRGVVLGQGNRAPTDADDAERYWEGFAQSRVGLCSGSIDANNRDIDVCENGQQRMEDFFGNNGLQYPNVIDVEAGTYSHVGIYIADLVIAPTYSYRSNVSTITISGVNPRTDFSERTVRGLSLFDLHGGDPNFLPLNRINQNIVVPNALEDFTLEIRIFLKNLLMHHRIETSSILDSILNTILNRPSSDSTSFISVSDWKEQHTLNTSLSLENIILRTRVYIPNSVGSIVISNDTGTSTDSMFYYAVMLADSNFNPLNEIPLAATSGNSSLHEDGKIKIKNLPFGQTYDLYKTCDLYYLNAAGNRVLGKDGYPETASICQEDISFTNLAEETVDVSCNCVP